MIERQSPETQSDTEALGLKDSEIEKYRDAGDPKIVRDKRQRH